MLHPPVFDPNKMYYENWEHGPFNRFADGVVVPTPSEARFSFFNEKINYPTGAMWNPYLAKEIKAAYPDA
ncbi:MAG TPA: hypothetical protein VJH91_02400 [Candidatus Paceibacterota bacterium]